MSMGSYYDDARLDALVQRCQEVKRMSQFEYALVQGAIDARNRGHDIDDNVMRQLERISRRLDR